MRSAPASFHWRNRRRDLLDGAGRAVGAQLLGLPSDRRGPGAELGLVAPDTDDECGRVDHRLGPPDRIARGAHPVALLDERRQRGERQVELGRVLRCQPRRLGLAAATHHDRQLGLRRLGQPGGVGHRVDLAAVAERRADRVAPQPADDRQLVGQRVEARPGGREVERVGLVLGLVPAGADAQLDPATAHLVHLGDADRQQTRAAERHRGDERAEADGRGVAGQAGERDPRVGRTGKPVAVTHDEVVVAAEEGPEAQLLGAPGDGEQVVVRRPLLRFGEDAEVGELHAAKLCADAHCQTPGWVKVS